MKMEPIPEWGDDDGPDPLAKLRATLIIVCAIWYLYAALEILGAVAFHSIALWANAMSHFAKASVNLLLLVAPLWRRWARRRLAFRLSSAMLALAIIFVLQIVAQLKHAAPPSANGMALIGGGALLADAGCAVLVAWRCHRTEPLAAAAARRLWPHAITGPMIVLAALAGRNAASAWPDLVIGLGIAVCNIRALHDMSVAANIRWPIDIESWLDPTMLKELVEQSILPPRWHGASDDTAPRKRSGND